MNTGAAFGFLLRGRPCKPFNSDQRIHIPATGLYTYPAAAWSAASGNTTPPMR